MKKILRNAVAASLAALVSFSMISCGGETEETFDIGKEPDSDKYSLHQMILPSGTGVKIPAWSKASDGVQNLPEVVTEFTTPESDFKTLNGKTNRTAELKAALQEAIASKKFEGRTPKNVIIVFADGWGESHTVGARQYYGELFMDELPYHAPVNHDAYKKAGSVEIPCPNTDDTSIQSPTDSTAGGSAINTGFTTRYGYSDLDLHGTDVKNLAELAREKGMLVGNVTNDCQTDATPETVLIHYPTRYDGNGIAAKQFLSSPDFQMGRYGFGGLVSLTEELHGITDDENGVHYDIFDGWYAKNKAQIKAWSVGLLNQYDGKDIDDASEYDMSKWAEDRKMVYVKKFSTFMSSFGKASTAKTGPDKRYVVEITKSHDFDYSPELRTAPCIGYKLGYGSKADSRQQYPNYAEMVASTLYVLDTQAKANGDCGFFCLIENTCPDGWGHKGKQYDCINEAVMTDEGVAIAVKYVLENPDTLLVVTADHETGGVNYDKGWETDYNLITSKSHGDHSSRPVPVYAFGAKSELWDDSPRIDFSTWSYDDLRKFAAGDMYPAATEWRTEQSAAPKAGYEKFPKILRNRTTGIRIGKAMGFEHYGDLNGNGILDNDAEYDSIVGDPARLPGSALH